MCIKVKIFEIPAMLLLTISAIIVTRVIIEHKTQVLDFSFLNHRLNDFPNQQKRRKDDGELYIIVFFFICPKFQFP